MKKSSPLALTDDCLLREFDTLPDHQLLVSWQVAMVLQCTERWLEEQRSRGEPPPYIELGARMVRYAVGPLRNYIRDLIENATASPTEARAKQEADTLGFDEPILTGGRRKKTAQRSFSSFMATGALDQEWPFVLVGDHRRPVDFIDGLTSVDPDTVVGAAWLTLDAYLLALRETIQVEVHAKDAQQERARLEASLPSATTERKSGHL